MKELTTENIEKSLEELIGLKPDSFLIVVRAQGQTALCTTGNHADNAINLAILSDYVQDFRKRKTNYIELDDKK